MKAPADLLSDIMRRLELNGKKFEVETACSDNELESFWEILLQIESSLSLTLLEIRSETRFHCRSLFPTVVSYDITRFASRSVGKKGAKCVSQSEWRMKLSKN